LPQGLRLRPDFWPSPHPPEALGRPSRKAATAALHATVAILEGRGLKGALSEALAEAPGLGGQERRYAALVTRELCRHQRLLDLAGRLLGSAPGEWALREDLALARYVLWRRLFTDATPSRIQAETLLPGPLRPRSVADKDLARLSTGPLPPEPQLEGLDRIAARESFPTWLAEAMARLPGEPGALMAALNREPGLVLRTRPAGTALAQRAALAASGVVAEVIDGLPDALHIPGRGARVFETAPMKKGGLQVQDAGSQLIVALCRPDDGFAGATFADVCAGAGGKTLALADLAGPGGRVDAWDRSQPRLGEARRRARELGLRNVRFPKELALGEADVILVDAPCSGSGNLSREPDLKWKLTPRLVAGFAERQRKLLSDTLSAAGEGAVVVYATCSLLAEENEQVVEQLTREHPNVEVEDASALLPESVRAGRFLRVLPGTFPGGGFFGARLRKGKPGA
jgi:16S rRNA (cytosine967-C5)-methyltransferase